MKHLKKVIALCALFSCSSLFALPGDDNIATPTGLYLQIQSGIILPQKLLDPSTPSHTDDNFSVFGNYFRGKYSVGYQVARGVGIQMGYFQAVNRVGDSPDAGFRGRSTYWDAAAAGFLRVSEHMTMTGLLGLTLAHEVVTGSTDSNTPDENLTSVIPEIGMGAQYNFTPNWAVSFQPLFIFRSGSIHEALFLPFGVSYTF